MLHEGLFYHLYSIPLLSTILPSSPHHCSFSTALSTTTSDWSDSQTTLTPPKFTQQLEEAEVKAGQPLRLDVTVEGDPVPEVRWYKDNVLLKNGPNIKVREPEGMNKCMYYSELGTVHYVCTGVNV